MKFNFSTFGQDLLKVLEVATVVAEEAEPIVDLTNPGVAQVYNLSARQAASVIGAFTQQVTPPASASADATQAPVADIAPSPTPVVESQPLAAA